ncbi:MAG: hypothetical protein JOY77_07405, partial [Alphaproteobacteria bacterium]|nr:hypothetical protein [Alphaproteobacteria bacterium]
TRHRALIDVNKPIKESQVELNRKKFHADQARRREVQEKVWRQMNLHVENAIRARMGDPTAEDRIAEVLRDIDERKERERRAAAEEEECTKTEDAEGHEDAAETSAA